MPGFGYSLHRAHRAQHAPKAPHNSNTPSLPSYALPRLSFDDDEVIRRRVRQQVRVNTRRRTGGFGSRNKMNGAATVSASGGGCSSC